MDFGRAILGRHDVVDGAVELPRFDVGVFGRFVIEHLDLHSGISRIAHQWRAYPDAIISAFLQLEIQAQNEI